MNNDLLQTAFSFAKRLQAIDYNALPISDYNKQYIGNMKPALKYYMRIYATCLDMGLSTIRLPPFHITLIDYGGGSGFLSMLAKAIGIKQVIYIDHNPASVETIRLLKAKTGIGPDVILQGDSDVLANWCKENDVKPDLLIATDLIEHVYKLPRFFSDLIETNSDMHMIFTTGSNPYNPFKLWKLFKLMQEYDGGTIEPVNYFTLRENFIAESFPELNEVECKFWAVITRGQTFEDIEYIIRRNKIDGEIKIEPCFFASKNTCDPRTGNWVERVLTLREYRAILNKFRYELEVDKGFYNIYQKNPFKAIMNCCLNGLMDFADTTGFRFAPFIILSCSKKSM